MNRKKRYVIHIFYVADNYFHIRNMVPAMVTNLPSEHLFFLFCETDDGYEKTKDLKGADSARVQIFPCRVNIVIRFLLWLLNLARARYSECQIISVLKLFPYRKNILVSHLTPFIGVKIPKIFPNVSWVSWAFGPELKTQCRADKILLLKRVIALNESDRDLMIQYGIPESKISTIPYFGTIMFYNNLNAYLGGREANRPKSTISVLAGNSNCLLWTYPEVIRLLERFSDKIRLCCMRCYGNFTEKDEVEYNNAVHEYGKKIEEWTAFFDDMEYLSHLDEYDIYICNAPFQFSLGNIYRALYLGKKVFLRGKNYSYFHDMTFFVWDVEYIGELTFAEFSAPLTEAEIQHNRTMISQILDPNILVKKWEDFVEKVSEI